MRVQVYELACAAKAALSPTHPCMHAYFLFPMWPSAHLPVLLQLLQQQHAAPATPAPPATATAGSQELANQPVVWE